MNDAVIFHPYFTDDHLPMVELTRARHQVYADKHRFDLLHVDLRKVNPGVTKDDAQKEMVLYTYNLMNRYDFIAWLDLDTLIWDMNIDLRLATSTTGAVRFQADKPLPSLDEAMNNHHFGWYNNHLNCGIVYIRRNDFTVKFVEEWLSLARKIGTWYSAQNAYNILAIKYELHDLDVRWNYNRNRHGECHNPIVRGYHGYMGVDNKMREIKADLKRLI